MNTNLKVGDRVKIIERDVLCDTKLRINKKGTVVGFEDPLILVKFDNFGDGHTAYDYYQEKGLDYDPEDRSHWWMCEWQIGKIQGKSR